MASISGASSNLGNTSLRGFGGFASGIDRDSIIEQMTMGTTTKINNKKSDITSLEWKQEAFQSVSSKILEFQDNYFSYASGKNLKDASVFAKSMISVLGDPDVTKFVTATGTSPMVDYLSILGVKQRASSATVQSNTKVSSPISTGISDNSFNDPVNISRLKGTRIEFSTYNAAEQKLSKAGTFTFPATYQEDRDGDGELETYDIDYSAAPEDLVDELNKALDSSNFTLGDNGKIRFGYDSTTNAITLSQTGDVNYVINGTTSSALSALGFDSSLLSSEEIKNGISLTEFNASTSNTANHYLSSYNNMADYLKGKELTITYGGQTKKVELVKSSDLDSITGAADPMAKLQEVIQSNIDRAFGSGKITVGLDSLDPTDPTNRSLTFNAGQTLTVTSGDAELRDNLGIVKDASTTLVASSSIKDNLDKLVQNTTANPTAQQDFLNSLATDGLIINGVKIEGVDENTSINDMIKKINANKDAGVTASYLKGSNQFVLVANETGKGREITLGKPAPDGTYKGAAATLFGGISNDGTDAEIRVSYGNGVETTIESSSNTFNLEGLNITVTGTFGYKKDADGNITDDLDSSEAITFSASADAEGVTELVKKFIEEYNAMVTEINSQITTKPDKSYGPLTEEQKDEMTESSIENWEKKAKQGLLYNDSTMRELSMDVQSILSQIMGQGVSYQDLEKMGITMSDDYKDGGTLNFDESKFKQTMNEDPDLISNTFTGGGGVGKGLTQIMEDTLSKYATRYSYKNGNSNGRLIEEAGSEKLPSSLTKNQIYNQLKSMQEELTKLQNQLTVEQDRYISQFTTMEQLISQMNSQSSYLASLTS